MLAEEKVLYHWISVFYVANADERDCATTSSSINDVLRRKLLPKKTSNSAEVTAKAARLERLERWHRK